MYLNDQDKKALRTDGWIQVDLPKFLCSFVLACH